MEKQPGLPKGSGLSTGAWLGRTTQALETVTAWEDSQEQKKVLSIVAQMLDRRTGTLRMMASRRKRRDRECGRKDGFSLLTENSGDRVGGSVLLLMDGKVPYWVRLVKRMDVLRSQA